MRCAVVVLLCPAALAAAAVGPARPQTESTELVPAFADSFGDDSRADYRLEGDVSWEPGSMTLNAGAAAARTIEGGPWTAIALHPASWESEAARPETDLRVWLHLDKARDCYVRFYSRRDGDGTATTIALVDTERTDGNVVERRIREASVGNVKLHRIGVEYRYGLVRIRLADEVVFRAWMRNGAATVRACRVEAVTGDLRLRHFEARTNPRDPDDYSDAERQQLIAATAQEREMSRCFREGRIADAAAISDRVLTTRRSILGTEHPYYATSLNNAGFMYARLGQYDRAEGLHRQALAVRRKVLGPEHPDVAESLNNLARLADDAGNFTEAKALYAQALEIRKLVFGEQHPRYANTLNNFATLYLNLGDLRSALPLYQRALEIRRAVNGDQHPDFATSLNNLAVVYSRMGDLDRAESLYRQALAIRKATLGDRHPEYANTLNNLALLYQQTGDYVRAVSFSQQALDVVGAVLGDQHPVYASSLTSLAALYEGMGDVAQAEPLFASAAEIRKTVLGEQHPDYAASLHSLAFLLAGSGDDDRAEALFRKALAIRKAVLGDQHSDCAMTLNSLALLCERRGDVETAESLFHQALEIWKTSVGDRHPAYATVMHNLAGFHRNRGNLDVAERLGRQALAIREAVFGIEHPACAESLHGIAETDRRRGDYRRAQKGFLQALQIQRTALDRRTLIQSARQQEQNQARVRVYLDSLLANAVEGDLPALESLEALWQWKGAVTTRQQAYREVASRSELQPLFSDLQSVTRQLSALAERRPQQLPPSAPEGEQSFFERQRITWEQRFSELNDAREELEQQIAAGSEAFRRSRMPEGVDVIRERLPPRTAIVDFIEYSHAAPDAASGSNETRRYLAFVIPADGEPVRISLGPVKPLGDAITAFRRQFQGARPAEQIRQAAQAAAVHLRDTLWAPLEPHLTAAETVVLSPDTALGTLPFAALPGAADDTFLVEDYRIVMLPAVHLLPPQRRGDAHRGRATGLLVLGDVDYDVTTSAETPGESVPLLAVAREQERFLRTRGNPSERWEALPGFRAELDNVRDLYQRHFGADAPVATLSGADATEAAFLSWAPGYSTLHMITHGFFSDPAVISPYQAAGDLGGRTSELGRADPFLNTWMPGLLSGLVVAGANAPPSHLRDGILRASEIEAASLQGVELVVLSACETGLGAVAGGEGLTGLQRAFHIAGADSVIASLWKVEDRATQELMRRFYENLWLNNLSKVDALREAQLWMLRHPQELAALGIQNAEYRGLGGDRRRIDLSRPASGGTDRADPRLWAAFQLSGDWR